MKRKKKYVLIRGGRDIVGRGLTYKQAIKEKRRLMKIQIQERKM